MKKNKRCPYCGRPFHKKSLELPVLSGRQARIYQAVLASGSMGIDIRKLEKIMLNGAKAQASTNTMLRVNIFAVNQAIKKLGQRVEAKRSDGYYLTEA